MGGLLSKNVVTCREFADRSAAFPATGENGFRRLPPPPPLRSPSRTLSGRWAATLTLFERPNFLHFWRAANFAREINAGFTRCYENGIYIFVNPPSHRRISITPPLPPPRENDIFTRGAIFRHVPSFRQNRARYEIKAYSTLSSKWGFSQNIAASTVRCMYIHQFFDVGQAQPCYPRY